jgi:putative Holliday junction resolvase
MTLRILGIDYGDSRIGVAVSDPFGWTAQGIESISAKNGMESVFARIGEIINQYQPEKIIVGFPFNMNGTIGPRGEKTNEFIKEIEGKFKIPVQKWDERLTTVAAQKLMIETNTKKTKKRSLIDTIAATYILQGYLDSISK